tara:strand:+ start:3308 stop:4459 length:1152 start_codon:yes stop_codon:yes gene_type:complete
MNKRPLFNHIAPGLSALEKRMAEHIKPGGNWQDIPEDIPSKRLEQIRKTGGRTTYYGRLLYDKPSFTITTYFNRLGNSSNLHPEQQRMISIREGARLQSFNDNYVFHGSKTSQYKQIGNAVPPLLARAVAESIKPHLNNLSFIDLFAGAGGMSQGFLMEGYNLLSANEIDKNFFETYKQNHQKSELVLGDITDQEIVSKITSASNNKDVGVVIGGPPCQGFSYAGWRNSDDIRNQLFRSFVDIVALVKPEYFVMENVPGILTMRKGEAMKEIIAEFNKIGYHLNQPLSLKAEEFGVPQKRRRVFLIGSIKPIDISPPSILFSESDDSLPMPITVGDAILGLPKLKMGEGDIESNYEINKLTPYQELLASEIDFKEFYRKQSQG